MARQIKEIKHDKLSELCISYIAELFDVSNDFSRMLVNSIWNRLVNVPDEEKCWYIVQYIKRNLDIVDIGNELDDFSDVMRKKMIDQNTFNRMNQLNLELRRILMRHI